MALPGAVSAWDGEPVTASWPARCRKQQGVLLLTRSRVVHVPEGSGAAGATAATASDIRQVRLAPNRGPESRAAVEIALHEVKFIVELLCTRPRWEHQRQVGEALTRLIRSRPTEAAPAGASAASSSAAAGGAAASAPAGTAPSSSDTTAAAQETPSRDNAAAAEVDLDLALTSRELREQYAFLVQQTHALSRQQFLASHARDIAARAPLPQPPSAIDLTVLKVGSDGGCDLSTAEEEAVLKEFPAIAALYKAQVPMTLSRKDFWMRCLRSRYYLQASGREALAGQRADPLFDALEPPEPRTSTEASLGKGALKADVPAEVDLAGEPSFERDVAVSNGSALPSANAGSGAGRGGLAARLVAQLNERSARQLEEVLAKSHGGSQAASSSSTPAAATGSATAAAAPAAAASAAATAAAAASSTAAGNAQEDSEQQLLREAVERRRERLRTYAGEVEADFSTQPAAKAPRLSLSTTAAPARAATASAAAAHSSRTAAAPAASVDAAALDAARAWAAASSSGSAAASSVVKRVDPAALRVSTRAVLQAATEDIQLHDGLAERAAELRQRLPPEVQEVAQRCRSLLRHFWASRLSDTPLRCRLAAELQRLLPTLVTWDQELARASASARAGQDATAARGAAARALVPAIRRALEVQQRCLDFGEKLRIASKNMDTKAAAAAAGSRGRAGARAVSAR
eukprot:TRINITY_DN20112_c1_g1_i1.p1 TRINITY_DN20112_c1_g1~~TRINITY_DN20112_c1_g1_i1.p1  ORF type:complete len:703 (+),score=184.82 TRINITY_DN20112_c1_g1_i1:37-2109(+)